MGFQFQRVTQKMQIISFGENQGPAAAAVIEEAVKIGSWVLLQNCHLEPSSMSFLEKVSFSTFENFITLNLAFLKVCDGLEADSTHPEFRLWLSSVSSPYFPDGILQTGIKIVFDPPNRIKENILMYTIVLIIYYRFSMN